MAELDYFPDIARFEGDVPWMYLDTAGLVTCGVGHLLARPSAALDPRIRWTHLRAPASNMTGNEVLDPNHPATDAEVAKAWAAVSGMSPAHFARFYRTATDIRMAPGASRALCLERLDTEFLPGLRLLVPTFNGLPEGWRRVLVDMSYNLGLRGLGHGFPNFLYCIKRGDGKGAAKGSHRSTCRDDRNDWARDLLLKG